MSKVELPEGRDNVEVSTTQDLLHLTNRGSCFGSSNGHGVVDFRLLNQLKKLINFHILN